MSIITDEKIHLFVTNSSLIGREEIELIEYKIKYDIVFKKFIDELKEYYSILHKENTVNIEEITERIKEKLKGTSKILRLSAQILPHSEGKNVVRLAASSQSDVGDEEKFVSTYASAEKLVLMRIFRNSLRGEYVLYLVADDMNIVQNALVNFENFKRDFVADKNGVVKIKTDYIDEKIVSIVRLPISRFEIDVSERNDNDEYPVSDVNFKVLLKLSYSELSLSFQPITTDYWEKIKVVIIFNNDVVNPNIVELKSSLSASLKLPENPVNLISVVFIDNS